MVFFWLIPVDALGWDLVVTSSILLNPCLEAEGAIAHCTHRHKPCWFKLCVGTSERIAADEYFCFGAIYVSHRKLDVFLAIDLGCATNCFPCAFPFAFARLVDAFSEALSELHAASGRYRFFPLLADPSEVRHFSPVHFLRDSWGFFTRCSHPPWLCIAKQEAVPSLRSIPPDHHLWFRP